MSVLNFNKIFSRASWVICKKSTNISVTIEMSKFDGQTFKAYNLVHIKLSAKSIHLREIERLEEHEGKSSRPVTEWD